MLPNRLSDVEHKLELTGATVGVLAAYGKIVPQHIIDLFPNGIVNIHPSLLPKHRGPTPIESVILSGETSTGVSLMKLTGQLDAGPLLAQRAITLSPGKSKQDLADSLIQLGAEMLIEKLPELIKGVATVTPQNDSDATYDRLIEKNDGTIDWRKSAIQLEREVRAYLDWPKTRCEISGKKFIITAARATGAQPNQNHEPGTPIKLSRYSLGIQTSRGILEIERLKPEGKPEMTAQAFLAGYGVKLNKQV